MKGKRGYDNNRRAGNATSAKEGRAIYLRGVPPTWTAERMEHWLSKRWSVESVNLLPSKPNQRTRAAFVNFWDCSDAKDAENVCDGEVIIDDAGQSFWLGCSLKKDASKKVDVSCQNYSLPTEILDGFLYLGNRECLHNEAELKSLGIDYVLSVTSDENEQHICVPPWVHRLRLSAEDSEDQDLTMLFDPACSFIESACKAGGRILVHCVAGRSRSVSIVLAYLMRHRNHLLEDAFALVKERRPYVWPNDSFWEQLQAEESRLFCGPASLAEQAASPLPPRPLASAQLQEGRLSQAPKQLLDEFLRDLTHFSAFNGVTARAEVYQDRVDILDSAQKSASSWSEEPKGLVELEEMFTFYRFGQVQWCSQKSTTAPPASVAARW